MFSIYLQVDKFTLEEKVNVTTGAGWMLGRCVGNIAAIDPVDGRGWPGLCLEVKSLVYIQGIDSHNIVRRTHL